MGVLIPVGYGQATYVFRLAGIARAMTFSVGYNPDTIDPGAHAVDIRDAFLGSGKPWTAAGAISGWSWESVQVTEMDETGPIFFELAVNSVGSATGQTPAPNTSLLIRKNTAAGGRKNKGRIYCPPAFLDESQVSQTGVLETTYRGIVQGQFSAWLGALSSADLPAVILHSEPGTPTPITSVTLEAVVATQRRRMRR